MPKLFDMKGKVARNRRMWGWFRYGGMRKADLARHYGLSPIRVSQLLWKFEFFERWHARQD